MTLTKKTVKCPQCDGFGWYEVTTRGGEDTPPITEEYQCVWCAGKGSYVVYAACEKCGNEMQDDHNCVFFAPFD